MRERAEFEEGFLYDDVCASPPRVRCQLDSTELDDEDEFDGT